MTVRALPTLRFKDADVQRAYDAIREALQEGNGDRGNPKNRWLTVGDAVDGGVSRLIIQSGVDPNPKPPGPVDPGPVDPNPPEPPVQPKPSSVVLTISPIKPLTEENFTLTATVAGDQPTGTIQFRQDGELMTLDPVALSSNVATVTSILPKGTYTFIAEYSGDDKNLSSISNTLTVEIGSVWDGPPPAPTSLDASTDDPFQIYLSWTNPYIGDYAVTEIWGAKQAPPSPTVEDAVKLGEVASTSWVFTDVEGVALGSDENWYFWIRNRDTENLVSDWYPASAGVNGKTGTQPGRYLDILTGQITETQLYSDLGDKIDLIVPLDTRVNTVETDIVSLQNEDINLYAQLSLVSAGAAGFDSAKIWHFDNSSDITGWTVTNASALSVSGGVLTFTPTASGSSFSTATVSVSGSAYAVVKARIKRISGTEDTDWIGKLTYYYGSTSGYLTISEPTYDANGWATAEWDLSGETNWTGNTIIKLEFALGDAATSPWGGVFNVDWLAAGRNAPSASVAQVADLAQAQIGYCLIGGSASGHESKAACEAAGGVWYGNYPLAQSVKQVSVTDGVNTGTIEQKFTAQKTATDDLRLQYTVKIDNNGYVSGFGLASEPVNGAPYSDFMVRADRFSISNPTIPSWQKSITSLTHNGTVATVTTSTAHGYIAGHYVMLANVGDKYWNRTFKVTAAPTTTTFSIEVNNSKELCLNSSAASPATAASGKSIYCTRVIIPFIVTTSQTTENGVTIEPGVYMDMAQIKDATIEGAKIRDASITNAKIGNLIKSDSFPDTGLPSTPFSGWRLNKQGNLDIYGSFALYDSTTGVPIIQAGKINLSAATVKRLILTASNEVFSVGPAPTYTVTPSTITLTATASNLSSPTVSWVTTSGTYTGGLANGLTQTINPANMTTSVVTFKASCTVDTILYEDVITLAKLQEGNSAVFLYLSNENDSLPANSAGTLTGATSVVSAVKVYRGNTDVTISEGWTITAPDASGCTATVSGTSSKSVTLSSLTADRATVTVTATKTGEVTQTRVMTVTKQKQGVTGATGPAGSVGPDGARGSVTTSREIPAQFTPWNDNYAHLRVTSELGLGSLVIGDIVTLYNTTNGSTETRYCSATGVPGTWSPFQTLINGNLVVQGSIGANQLAANAISAQKVVLSTGAASGGYPFAYIRSSNFTYGGTEGFLIGSDGNAEFNNVKVRGDILLGGGNQIQNSDGLQGLSDIATWYDSGWTGTVPTFSAEVNATTGVSFFRFLQNAGYNNTFAYFDFYRSGGPTTGTFFKIPVQLGKTYQFSVDAYSGTANVSLDLVLNWYDASGWITNTVNTASTPTATSRLYLNATVAVSGGRTPTFVIPSFRRRCLSTTQNSTTYLGKVLFAEVPSGQVSPIPWSPGGISLLDTLGLRANAATLPRFAGPSSSGMSVSTSAVTVTQNLVLPATTDASARGTFILEGFVEFPRVTGVTYSGYANVTLDGTGWTTGFERSVHVPNVAGTYVLHFSIPFTATTSQMTFAVQAKTSSGTVSVSNTGLYLLEVKR